MALSGTDFDSSASILFRIKHSDIDAALTNYPVPLELGTAVGIKGNDVSAIFDELGSNANRLKIAVEDGDTGNQCYVDIEYWDDATEDATLHVKVPSVSISGYTYLRLYYDSSAADNTTYVSDSGGTAAQSVWDANYVFVAHHANDPNGDPASAIKDSTSNNHDGTPAGTMLTADLVDAFSIGKGIDFDNTDDYINFGASADHDLTGDMTIDVMFKPNSLFDSGLASDEPLVDRDLGGADGNQYSLEVDNVSGKLQVTAGGTVLQSTTATWASGTAFVVSFTLDDATAYEFWVDGVSDNDGATAASMSTDAANVLYTAYDGVNFLDGIIGEVRISDKVREDEWVKATALALTDTLVTADVEQITIAGNLFSTGLGGSIGITSPTITISGSIFPDGFEGAIYLARHPQVEITGTLFEIDGQIQIDEFGITGKLFTEFNGTIEIGVRRPIALTGSLFTMGGSVALNSGVPVALTASPLFEISSTVTLNVERVIAISGSLFTMTGSMNINDQPQLVISGSLLEMGGELFLESQNLGWEYSDTLEHSRFTKC